MMRPDWVAYSPCLHPRQEGRKKVMVEAMTAAKEGVEEEETEDEPVEVVAD